MTDTYGCRSDVATVLVQHMLDVVYGSGSSGGGGTDNFTSRKMFVLSYQKQELVNAIVVGADDDGEDSGTIEFPVLELDFDNDEKSNVISNVRSFRFATAKVTNDDGEGDENTEDQNTSIPIKPPTLHWMWQKKQNEDGTVEEEERLCLSLLASSGGELLLLADTTETETPPSPSSTSSSLAVRVSNFQWTIEASVSPPSSSPSSFSSGQIEVSTFWKFKTIEFWKKQKNNPGGAVEEEGQTLLVQFQDVTLMGTLLLSLHTSQRNDASSSSSSSSYQFMPRSILQMKIGHTHNGSSSQADDNPPPSSTSMLEDDLFSLWSTLDGIQEDIQFPNLMMTMTPPPSTSSTTSSATSDVVPFESTDQTSLGDIFQHYLANHLPSSSSPQPSGSTSISESSSLPPTWNVTSSLPTAYTRNNVSVSTESETPETGSVEGQGEAASSSSQLRQRLNERISSVRSSISSVNINVSDSVVATSALMASGTSFVTPIGAAVSVAALAAKDTVVAVAEKGKQTRLSQQPSSSSPDNKGEDEEAELLFDNVADATVFERSAIDAGLESGGGTRSLSSNTSRSSPRSQNDSNIIHEGDKYKFGDLTRGVVASIREKRQQQQGGGDTDQNGSASSTTAEYLKANEGKFVGVMGASAGAGVGLLVAGPIGAVAGSVTGSLSSQAALRRQREQQFQQESNRSFGGGEGGSQVEASATSSSFRIGDNFRSLVAKGKEASARVVSSAQPSSSTSIEQLNGEGTRAETTPTTTSVLKSKASLFGANLRGAVAKGKAAAEGAVEKGRAAAEGVVVEGKTSTGRDADSTYRFGDFSRGLIKSYKNRGSTTAAATANPPSAAAPPSSIGGNSQPATTGNSSRTQAHEGSGDVTEQNNNYPVTRSV